MAIKSQDTKTPATSNGSSSGWKTQAYAMGILGGVLFGLLAAYLFARGAEEDANRNGGKPQSISSGQIITIALAVLGLMRQISELGKPAPKK
jgi:hypothetical protein